MGCTCNYTDGIWTDGGVYVTENKLNVDLSYGLKGSYTVEGTIIIPIFIVMLAIEIGRASCRERV